MSKSLNIRIEKKPEKYKGPKVVCIEKIITEHASRFFHKHVNESRNMLIICIKRSGKRHVYSTFTDEDSVAQLEITKDAFLNFR